jgi:hypothetical protein
MTPLTAKETSAELDWLTDRISTQVRWFAGGVVALVWGVLETPPKSIGLSSTALVLVGLSAVSILFFDFAQYVAAFVAARRSHNKLLETADQTLPGYDPTDLARRARTMFFWVKIVLTVLTFFGLFATVLAAVVKKL